MYCGPNYRSVLEELARREDMRYSYRDALVAEARSLFGYRMWHLQTRKREARKFHGLVFAGVPFYVYVRARRKVII